MCLFLCQMWFSWIALRESKVFHLGKVISSGLPLALFPSDSRWNSGLGACVVWRESQCTFLAGRRWPQMLIQRQSHMEWGLSLYSQIAFLLSSPPPKQVTFFILFVPPAWILNTFLKEWLLLAALGTLLLLWGFSLVPTPVLRNSASPGHDMAKALFLQIQKRQESLWHFVKPSLRRDARARLFCNVRNWKVAKELQDPT